MGFTTTTHGSSRTLQPDGHDVALLLDGAYDSLMAKFIPSSRLAGMRPLVFTLLAFTAVTFRHASADETPAAVKTDASHWYPMPECLPPEVAEFSNVKPGGTADVHFREGVSLNPEKTEHLQLSKGYYIALSMEMEAAVPKRAWVFLVQVLEVLAKDKAKVRFSKQTAKMLNEKHQVTFFQPKGIPTKQLKTFPTKPVEVDVKEVLAPRPEPAPKGGLPKGPYLLVANDAQGEARVSVVTPIADPDDPAAVTEPAASAVAGKGDKTDEVPFPTLPEGAGKIDENAPKKFKKTASGLKYRILRKGEGRKAVRFDGMTMHFQGWLDDGTIFTSTYAAKKPFRVMWGGGLKGWAEGINLVKQGGMIELVIPPELGYGEKGQEGAVPPNATLHYLVEMLEVKRIQ